VLLTETVSGLTTHSPHPAQLSHTIHQITGIAKAGSPSGKTQELPNPDVYSMCIQEGQQKSMERKDAEKPNK
jgi:hypothetical protein